MPKTNNRKISEINVFDKPYLVINVYIYKPSKGGYRPDKNEATAILWYVFPSVFQVSCFVSTSIHAHKNYSSVIFLSC